VTRAVTHPAWRRRIGWILLVALILAAAAEFGVRGLWRALSDTQDLAVIYASTRAFQTGHNPYDPAAMQAAWREANHNHPNPSDPPPIDLALYPPSTYLLLSPLALLDWTAARFAWLFLNLIAVAALIVTLTRFRPYRLSPAKSALTAAFILGFGPIQTAIAKGQLAVLVVAILAIALVVETRRALILAAILIGLAASLKPQLAAPVVLLYLIQTRWKELAVVAGVTSALLAAAWLRLSRAGISWISSLRSNLNLAAQPGGVYDPSATNLGVYQLVNASALFRRLIANQALIVLLLAVIGALVCFFLLKRGLWKRRRFFDLVSDPAAFAAACVLGLVLVSHRYYDASVLVFVFVWGIGNPCGWRRTVALISIAGCLIVAFPLPALLIASGHSRAPHEISQTLWNAAVIQHQAWVLLVVLVALTAALTDPRDSDRFGRAAA
jgi:hypothetical protein